MDKYCPRCEETRDIALFNKDKQTKDGLRTYCKQCEKDMYIEKKEKKEAEEIENSVTNIVAGMPGSQKETTDVEKYNVSVDHLARQIAKQYGEDVKKADEVYDLFYNKIAGGDNSSASKEALTKSLELRMSAGDNIQKLVQIASKLQEAKDKGGKKSNYINMKNVKDEFSLD